MTTPISLTSVVQCPFMSAHASLSAFSQSSCCRSFGVYHIRYDSNNSYGSRVLIVRGVLYFIVQNIFILIILHFH